MLLVTSLALLFGLLHWEVILVQSKGNLSKELYLLESKLNFFVNVLMCSTLSNWSRYSVYSDLWA